jgi:hypothetical protein
MITDPVWREDIVDEQDVMRDAAKIFHDWARRLRYHNAPSALVQRVERLRDTAAQMNDELQELQPCFPEQ